MGLDQLLWPGKTHRQGQATHSASSINNKDPHSLILKELISAQDRHCYDCSLLMTLCPVAVAVSPVYLGRDGSPCPGLYTLSAGVCSPTSCSLTGWLQPPAGQGWAGLGRVWSGARSLSAGPAGWHVIL